MKAAALTLSVAMSFVAAGSVSAEDSIPVPAATPVPRTAGAPIAATLIRGASSTIDLRSLPQNAPVQRDRPEREEPDVTPVELPGDPVVVPDTALPVRNLAAPSPIANFIGLDFANWGAGRPPDPNGDVGPTHYIQVVNSSIGIYQKSTGTRVAALTFDTFMSQGAFGNLCDTDNFGDPVVLYDTFEDRWLITDFAFQLDGSGNVVNPPGAYQCIAVSKSGDPVAGGWNFYSLHITDGLHDYPKFGVWPDGIYMSANIFAFPANGPYLGPRVWALNKAQMYAGAPTIQVVQFNPPQTEFTLLPSNARLQEGTPPAGTPNYFNVVWQFTNAVSVYKFHVDWNSISLSSFTGPFIVIAPASWSGPPSTVPAQGGNPNDTLALRLMAQNQYTNLGGVESLWNSHTVLGGAAGTSAPRYYQTIVTGGTIAASTAQAFTHTPDTVVNRYMGSGAVDRAGNFALGYSVSSATLFPGIRYAGRLASDPVNSLPQTETSLFDGAGSQNSTNRWGDYSAMSVDPDGCTFWYTNEYFAVTGVDWQTRIGSFKFPTCTPVGSGTLQGTVTATPGGAPIGGATINFGSRTTTTNGSGVYSFAGVPSGTYPVASASAPAYIGGSAGNIVVTDGSTTTQNFSLPLAPISGCFLDTTQANFQTGVATNVDLTTSVDNVILLDAPILDQQNATLGNSGVGITTTTFGGQTFTLALSGKLTQVDINLFCSGCTGTTPALTLSIRATSAGLPTGADIASATIPGFSSGAAVFYTADFAVPPTLTAGTQYALVIRPTVNPSLGTYALTRSGTSTVGADVYAGGTRVSGASSGTVWSIPATGGITTDAGFRIYIKTGFAASGDLVSSLKDANPALGVTPRWTTLGWNAATPASSSLRFQAAASNSPSGPFNFVGPDGTAATFFTTSGASLGQFNGLRYLKSRALFASTDSTVTPTLNDVTTCFLSGPDLTIDDVSHDEGNSGTTTFTFTVSLSAPAPAGGVTFDIATADGTAIAPGDYTARSLTSQTIPAGSTTYTFDVLVNGDTTFEPNETFFVNVTNLTNAFAADTQGQGTIVNDDTSADLSVTNADSPDPVIAGNNLTYTLAVNNAGPTSAASVSLSDPLPAGTTFVSLASPPAWTCSTPAVGAAGTVSCSNPLVPIGSSAFTLVVKLAASTPASAIVSNIATVSSTTPDPTPGNQSAIATTTVSTSADVSVTKVATPDPVMRGNSITYTITVGNAGPSNAASVSLTDSLPAATTFVSLVSPGGWSCTTPAVGAGGTVSCSNASLGPGSPVFTLVANVAASTPVGTLVSNTATVSSPTSDPNPGNQSGTATTTVGAADLANLVLSAGLLEPSFQTGTLSYFAGVASNGNTITVTPTLADPTASVKVNGATVASGSASGPITLNLGGNTITIVVTGSDSVTTKTYTVSISYLLLSSCTYAMAPLDRSNLAAAGGPTTVVVTTPAGCPVTTTTFQPWATVTGITHNAGTTTVTIQIDPNIGPARYTVLRIADRLYLIHQLGP